MWNCVTCTESCPKYDKTPFAPFNRWDLSVCDFTNEKKSDEQIENIMQNSIPGTETVASNKVFKNMMGTTCDGRNVKY